MHRMESLIAVQAQAKGFDICFNVGSILLTSNVETGYQPRPPPLPLPFNLG